MGWCVNTQDMSFSFSSSSLKTCSQIPPQEYFITPLKLPPFSFSSPSPSSYIGSHHRALAGLDLTMQTSLALSSQFAATRNRLFAVEDPHTSTHRNPSTGLCLETPFIASLGGPSHFPSKNRGWIKPIAVTLDRGGTLISFSSAVEDLVVAQFSILGYF